MDTNAICNLQTGICEENQNFYSMCKPTLFPLRFIGGPPGLWRSCGDQIQQKKYRKFCAFLMLFALNLGAVGDFYFTIRTSTHINYTFNQNMNQFFVLAISVSGTIGLDILWWRRRQLKELLDSIDYEPKMCETVDAECRTRNQIQIRNKTIKMFIFLIFFSGYTNFIYAFSSSKSRGHYFDYTSFEFHANVLMYILGFLAVYPFCVTMSLYIAISWVFRLKVKRIIKILQEDIEHARNGRIPSRIHAKAIELWFSLYLVQFKKYDLVFKQIAGLIYVVLVWSVLSMAQCSINSVLNQELSDFQSIWDFIHEFISVAVLVYFLHSLSSVEYSLRRFVKHLYRLSLKIKFVDSTDESTLDLSEKYQLLGETAFKSGLNLSLFGIMHISRSLIITTFSLLVTYGLLMYELFGNHNKTMDNCQDNSTITTYLTPNQTDYNLGSF